MAMSRDNRTRSALSEDLSLYTTKIEEPLSFGYEIECTSLKCIYVTLNFEGSENFMVEGKNTSELTISATVKPFSRQPIGKIFLMDKKRRAMLKMNCEWRVDEPNQEELELYLQGRVFAMNKILRDTQVLNFPPLIEDPDCRIVEQLCNTYAQKFVDFDFSPSEVSLYSKNPRKGVSGAEERNKVAANKKIPIEWRRPEEFMTGPYDVFEDGIEPRDIRQGALGDCWLLCSLTALTEFPELVLQLFPEEPESVNRCGVYNIRVCKNGLWKTLRLDDYFPCYAGGGPIYSRSHGNELWVMLLEKAFAKLCGSYEAIKAGWAYEAMIDLTGAPYKTYRLDDPDVKAKINSGELWATLSRYDGENFILSASTPGEDVYTESGRKPGKEDNTGLVAGHAYTLIAVRTTSRGDRLVKMRNPWGNMEWAGDWSDSSPLWTEQMQAEIEPLIQEDDGTFWMCFEDMLQYFYSVNVCMVRHPGLNASPWNEARRQFFFEFDPNANNEGTSSGEGDSESQIVAPTFILNVHKAGKFIASVHQEDIRCANAKPYIDIGVTIMQVNPVYGTFSLVTGTGVSVDRQNQSNEFDLQPGKYIVVPTTSGCKLKQQYNERTAESPKVALISQNENGEVQFTSATYRVYEEIFSRMDNDDDGYLNMEELNAYMVRTEGVPIEEKAYLWLLHNFESIEKKGLTCAGFIRAQLFVFRRTGANEDRLREELRLMGYNDALEFDAGRKAVLVIHSTVEFSINTHDYDEQATKEALELPIVAQGECSNFEDGKIKLYKYRSGYYGLSFVVENRNPESALIFILDCSNSANVISHRGSLNHEETIPPGQSRIVHHLMPKDYEAAGWSWAYSASYMWDEE